MEKLMGQMYLRISAGIGKNGESETYGVLELRSGEMAAIVGPTGSGKTALINDIEIMAQRDTITKRRVEFLDEDRQPISGMEHPCVLITQNTKCFSDVKVSKFLEIHSIARGDGDKESVEQCIALANRFSGEPIAGNMDVTTLSGGQTRALLIADAILIGRAPLIILDEVENAGIYKERVMELVKQSGKMIIFVTHDPAIALSVDKRLVMKEGCIHRVIERTSLEKQYYEEISVIDTWMNKIREQLRMGKKLDADYLEFRKSILIRKQGA